MGSGYKTLVEITCAICDEYQMNIYFASQLYQDFIIFLINNCVINAF